MTTHLAFYILLAAILAACAIDCAVLAFLAWAMRREPFLDEPDDFDTVTTWWHETNPDAAFDATWAEFVHSHREVA